VGVGRSSSNRVTVDEAARVLGLSVDAIRKRVQRGTIDYERAEDGRVWILLDAVRSYHDIEQDKTGQQPADRMDLLIAELQDRVRSLEESNRENRRIIAALTQRIPSIEAPAEPPAQEPPGTPTEATEQPGRVEPQPSVEGAQEPSERRRSWWREFFGFE
jgi:hypothetical protein